MGYFGRRCFSSFPLYFCQAEKCLWYGQHIHDAACSAPQAPKPTAVRRHWRAFTYTLLSRCRAQAETQNGHDGDCDFAPCCVSSVGGLWVTFSRAYADIGCRVGAAAIRRQFLLARRHLKEDATSLSPRSHQASTDDFRFFSAAPLAPPAHTVLFTDHYIIPRRCECLTTAMHAEKHAYKMLPPHHR